jgi:hypothetical protein
MYCLSCLLLHLKNDNRCPLCRTNIEDSESSEEDEEDEDEEEPVNVTNRINISNVDRYQLYGIIHVNHNMKVLIVIIFFSIQFNIIDFIGLCIKIFKHKT